MLTISDQSDGQQEEAFPLLWMFLYCIHMITSCTLNVPLHMAPGSGWRQTSAAIQEQSPALFVTACAVLGGVADDIAFVKPASYFRVGIILDAHSNRLLRQLPVTAHPLDHIFAAVQLLQGCHRNQQHVSALLCP